MLQTKDDSKKILHEMRFTFSIDSYDPKIDHDSKEWSIFDHIHVQTPSVMATVYKMFMKTGNFHYNIGQYCEASTYYKYAADLCSKSYSDLMTSNVASVDLTKQWLNRMRAARNLSLLNIRQINPGTVDKSIVNIWS